MELYAAYEEIRLLNRYNKAKGWLNRFGRHYDVSNLISRLVNQKGEMELTIYFLTNEKTIDPGCYAKFVALFKEPT